MIHSIIRLDVIPIKFCKLRATNIKKVYIYSIRIPTNLIRGRLVFKEPFIQVHAQIIPALPRRTAAKKFKLVHRFIIWDHLSPTILVILSWIPSGEELINIDLRDFESYISCIPMELLIYFDFVSIARIGFEIKVEFQYQMRIQFEFWRIRTKIRIFFFFSKIKMKTRLL